MRLFLGIPCQGATSAWPFYFVAKDRPLGWSGPMYPRLQSRLYMVLDCASIASFRLHALDQLHTNRTHYFVEGETIRYYTKERGAWEWKTKPLEPHLCYYLGSFQNYWNYRNNVLVKPHDLMTWDVYGIGLKPHHPEIWSWVIEHVPAGDWIAQFGDKIGTQLQEQKKTLDRREQMQQQCYLEKYERTPAEIRNKRRPKNFNELLKDALQNMGVGSQPRTFDPYKRKTQEEWDEQRRKYIEENGYVIRIPQLDDIIHLTPNSMKSPEEIKLEKKLNLMRIMESPSPQFAKKYASVMTWIDNVQDTTSIIYPAIRMLGRIAPKAFKRLLPVLGWLMLPGDLLDIANALGRAVTAPMSMKRAVCDLTKHNPLTKNAQYKRKERIDNLKPGWGDIIQALQVLDQLTGVGISLGAIMGTAMDIPFGIYKYLNGEKVRVTFDPPSMYDYEKYAGKGLRYSALINTAGQTFSEELHFWNFFCGACSTLAAAPITHAADLGGIVEDPMNVVIPADIPTDPITIAVIKEAGLDVEKGVGWPFNDSKEISLGDLSDAIAIRSKEVFKDYIFRHTKDWYGYTAANLWDHSIPIIIQAMDPSGEEVMDDTDEMKVFYRMIKAPLLPTAVKDKKQSEEFFEWCRQHKELTGHLPGIQAIQEKFDLMGIPYRTTYPTTIDPEAKDLWPEGFPGSDYL